MTERFVNEELDKLPVGYVPIFTTNGYKPYRRALLKRYGLIAPRSQGRGRPGANLLVPPPELNCAVVEKTRKGKKMARVARYNVYGHVPNCL